MTRLTRPEHELVPEIDAAPLPKIYERATVVLQKLTKVDECARWADKAQALASYARQAEDDRLRKMCDRIQARAVRRCGELLREIAPGKPGPQTPPESPPTIRAGARPDLSRAGVARAAGLSVHQRKQALRVAKIPEAEFEAAIESPDPPTVTELAERGTVKRPESPESPPEGLGGAETHPDEGGRYVDMGGDPTPTVDLEGRDPEAVLIHGALQHLAAELEDAVPSVLVRGLLAHEHARLLELAIHVRVWLGLLEDQLRALLYPSNASAPEPLTET